MTVWTEWSLVDLPQRGVGFLIACNDSYWGEQPDFDGLLSDLLNVLSANPAALDATGRGTDGAELACAVCRLLGAVVSRGDALFPVALEVLCGPMADSVSSSDGPDPSFVAAFFGVACDAVESGWAFFFEDGALVVAAWGVVLACVRARACVCVCVRVYLVGGGVGGVVQSQAWRTGIDTGIGTGIVCRRNRAHGASPPGRVGGATP